MPAYTPGYMEFGDAGLLLASAVVAVFIAWKLHRQAVSTAYAEGYRDGQRAGGANTNV